MRDEILKETTRFQEVMTTPTIPQLSQCRSKRRILLNEREVTVSQRTSYPQGFYAEECDKDKEEEDDWQAPDKFQRISQVLFCNGELEIPPIGGGVLSSPCVQNQGGGCSALDGHDHEL